MTFWDPLLTSLIFLMTAVTEDAVDEEEEEEEAAILSLEAGDLTELVMEARADRKGDLDLVFLIPFAIVDVFVAVVVVVFRLLLVFGRSKLCEKE